MKPFNLKEYLKNSSKKVVTRDGRDVRVICTDFNNPKFPVIGEIEGSKWPISFTAKGLFSNYAASDYDLFFASEKHEGWVNVYKDGDRFYSSMDILKTKDKAEALSCRSCIATVKIEWEE